MEIRSWQQAAAAVAELKRRRAAYPLAYAALWDREPPRTSQKRALSLTADPGALLTLNLGGVRTGKSEGAAMWGVAQAAGRDATIEGPEGQVQWVRRWLAINGFPEGMIPPGPGRVWVGSPSFGASCEQIRPKLRRWAPAGSTFRAWDNKGGEGEIHLPGGGVLVSKAYKQYDADPQTWEGANVRAIVFDEQPNQYANLSAAFSRLIDQRGRSLMALTPLRGKADWLYRELVQNPPDWLRIAYLHGADNPHIPQEWREMIIAAGAAWQRASRDVGAFTTPEGAILPLGRGTHALRPFPLPTDWIRWVGIDWGGRAPHITWTVEVPHAFTTPCGKQLRSGDLVTYRELAPRRTTLEPAITPRKLIQWAIELEKEHEDLSRSTIYRVADSEDPAAIQEAAELGWWVSPAEKGPGSVLQGLTMLEALFQTVDSQTLEPTPPRWYLFDTCATTIEEVEGLRWADVREGSDPRPDPACPDHGPDTMRYVARHRQAMGFR